MNEQPINPEEQIFEEARKIEDQEKRCAFLDGACRGDQKLRAQLNTMIEAHEGAEGFLDTLPDDQTVVENLDWLSSQYRLRKEEHGHVRSSPRPVNGEKTQARARQAVKMCVTVCHEFVGFFGGGIERNWVIHIMMDGKRHGGVSTIN